MRVEIYQIAERSTGPVSAELIALIKIYIVYISVEKV